VSKEVTDLTKVREEIEAIKLEALSFGYSVQGEKIGELRAEIKRMRKEREGKPLCYRRMWDRAAPQCAVCDLTKDCGGEDSTTADPDEIRQVQCEKCETGWLSVPETDDEEQVRNWGCTTTGCTNTLLDQTAFEASPPASKPTRKPRAKPTGKVERRKPKRKRKKIRRKHRTDAQLEKAILNFVKVEGNVKSKRALQRAIGSGQKRLWDRIDDLLERGLLEHDPVDGFIPGKGE
jgi:hypothetical protein